LASAPSSAVFARVARSSFWRSNSSCDTPRGGDGSERLSCFGSTRGEPESSASVASTTCGSTSYTTTTAARPSSSACGVSAQTAATGAPENVTRCRSRLIAESTPGTFFAAATSTLFTFACACGERSARANAMFGRLMSAV
jgi:hypothetical protein